MARPTHQNIRQLGDFATTVHWNLQVVKFPNAVPTTLTSDDLNLRIDSTDMPRSSGQSTTIQIRGLVHKQPGIYVPQGTLSLSFYETVDNKISSFIHDWREACFNMETGSQNTNEDVVAIIRLVRLDRQFNEIYEYIMYNVFLEDYDPGGQLQGMSADALKPQMTLSYDTFDANPL